MSQQPVELFLADQVAFAGAPFEAGSVEDRHASATVFDKFPALQFTRNLGHAGAPDTKHHSQKFLGEQKLIRVHTIARHQEPAAAPLLNRMEMSACGRLCHLIEESMRVMQHDSPRSAAFKFGGEYLGAEPQSLTRHLNICTGRRTDIPHDYGKANHSFVAYGADLGR